MSILKFLYKPQNELERDGRSAEPKSGEKEYTCPNCHRTLTESTLEDNQWVCACGHHFRIEARKRIAMMTDPHSFNELFSSVVTDDPLSFPGYQPKLEKARLQSGETESVVTGTATIENIRTAIFAMSPGFMMGSMGTATGERITRLFEYATEHRLPVVGWTVSGGARMQEGLLSLMQMAKTSGAVLRHSEAGLLYITVLTDPTTGGVTASFAMEGDIIIAEPGATVGFAGRRVVEQTTMEELPRDFQTSEFILDHGFADMITPRKSEKKLLGELLRMHGGSYDSI